MHKSRCFRCRAGARGAGKRHMSARTEARVQPRRAKFASRTPLSWSARQRTSRAIVLWRPAREEGGERAVVWGESTPFVRKQTCKQEEGRSASTWRQHGPRFHPETCPLNGGVLQVKHRETTPSAMLYRTAIVAASMLWRRARMASHSPARRTPWRPAPVRSLSRCWRRSRHRRRYAGRPHRVHLVLPLRPWLASLPFDVELALRCFVCARGARRC